MISRLTKIFVTGATGFIGANIVRRLVSTGFESIFVSVRKSSNLWRIKNLLGKIKPVDFDFADGKEVLKKIKKVNPEIIIHTATCGGFAFQDNYRDIIAANITNTVNLLESVKTLNLRLFVNTGSSSEYGIKSEPMSEDKSCFPMSFYGISKLCMTLFCRLQGLMSSLPVCTLRLFSPYGYCDDKNRLIPQVITSALLGRDIVISNPDNKRDYIFIDDVVNAYLKVISKKKFKGNIINIGSGKEYSVKNITEIILKLTGSKSKLKFKKSESKITESPAWMADITKAKEILEWEPAIDITPGLKKTIDWFKKNIHSYR